MKRRATRRPGQLAVGIRNGLALSVPLWLLLWLLARAARRLAGG
jgi:hypothetical protein